MGVPRGDRARDRDDGCARPGFLAGSREIQNQAEDFDTGFKTASYPHAPGHRQHSSPAPPCAQPRGNQWEANWETSAMAVAVAVAGSRGSETRASTGGGHKFRAGPSLVPGCFRRGGRGGAWGCAPPHLPASLPPPHPGLKGTEARWWVGICLVLEEKQPQIGFQGFESLHPHPPSSLF